MTPLLPTGGGSLSFALDSVSVPYLFLFGVIWTVSGLYSFVTTPRGARRRIFAYYLPSAIGGVTVALAADAISFYLCFALMALPAWGLITAGGTPEGRRAGAIYLTLTVIGEALLLAALALMAVEAGGLRLDMLVTAMATSPVRDLATGLLLASIALKIGTLPASGILPLSYAYAPAGPASALAGASAKVGALAMLRLLPAGVMPENWAAVVMLAGLTTAFGAAALGILTTTPRAVLGYSSASQMGLVLIAAGAGLADPAAVPLSHAAIIAFSLHHGLAKSALVLGDDIVARTAGRARSLALAGLALPALALVGAPLTSGFVAKYALKDAVYALSGSVPHAVYSLLPWAAVGTAGLMIRFFILTARHAQVAPDTRHRAPAALWGGILVLVAVTCWAWPATWNHHAIEAVLDPRALLTATWPALVALGLTAVVRQTRGVFARLDGALAPGDILVTGARLVRAANAALPSRKPSERVTAETGPQAGRPLLGVEERLVTWVTASTLFVLLAVALVLLATR
ncbi:MAG: hypothetical protein ISP10_03240 [Aeromicrobium sp.]|nr:hypothetical protein [Aeromicrobium sp.]